MEALIPLAIGVAAVVVVLLILLLILMRSYRIAAPNEALIITGRNAKTSPTGDIDLESGSARVIIGGRAIVRPIVDRAFVLSLSSRQIPVEVEGYSMNGIFLRLRGVAQVKVGGNIDDVRKASQRFLDQQQQIDHYTQEILSGTLRAVVGTLSVEQIIRDRASFASQVQAEAEHSMNNQGLVIDTFQISAIEDDGSYLRDWGRPEAALVAKRAAIAESDANRESTQATNMNLQQEAESKQAFDIRNAEIKEETDARQAVADASGPLARAAQQQRIIEQEELIAVRNNDLREKQLIAEVHKPAEAKRYAEQQDADSKKYAHIAESEAQLQDERNRAESRKVTADAEAHAIEARGRAEAEIELQRRSKDAEAVRLEGQAEADALRAKGEAEGRRSVPRATPRRRPPAPAPRPTSSSTTPRCSTRCSRCCRRSPTSWRRPTRTSPTCRCSPPTARRRSARTSRSASPRCSTWSSPPLVSISRTPSSVPPMAAARCASRPS